MKHLIFSHFLEIFLINLVEIKRNQPIHFEASGSVAGIMVPTHRYPYGPLSRFKHLCFGGRNVNTTNKDNPVFTIRIDRSWKFPRMWQKWALSLSVVFLLFSSPIPSYSAASSSSLYMRYWA